ncbi:MAG: hypothetical protein E7343_04370 [Clostridiales bacterium]|nr:hypothetical protein [Clostridiales bacterium]
MKLKKLLLSTLSLCLCFSATFVTACDDFSFNSIVEKVQSIFVAEPETEEEDDETNPTPPPAMNPSTNVQELLEGQSGTVTITADTRGFVIETVNYGELTAIGELGLAEAIVDGGEGKSIVTVTGGGAGAIAPITRAKLTFKNLIFKNQTDEYSRDYYFPEYLEFGGEIIFENCEFDCHVFLCKSANVEFKNCLFNSANSLRYGAWVCDGSAKFINCEFTGYRGLKIHEDSHGHGNHVTNVLIDGCTFSNLHSKPGIAIGDIHVKPSETIITVKNSQFNGCQPIASDAKEGYNGLYEKDYATVAQDGFVFNWRDLGNSVDGQPV